MNVLLSGVIEALEDGILLLAGDGSVLAANAAAHRHLAAGKECLAGRCAFGLFAQERVAGLLLSALNAGVRYAFQGALLRHDGQPTMTVDGVLEPLPANDESARAVLRFRPSARPDGVCDIALETSEARLRVILDTIVDAVVVSDRAGMIQLFNPAAEKLFGYPQHEVIGCNVNVLMPSPDRERHDQYIASHLRTGVRKIIGIGREVTGRKRDGTLFPLYLSIGETVTAGEPVFVAVLHDLTERKRDQERLVTLSSAVEQSSNAILITGADSRIEYVNPCFTALTGYAADEVIGSTPAILRSGNTPPETYEELWTALNQGRAWRGEIQDRRKDGSLYWALSTISPIRNPAGETTHFVGIQQDITDIKKDKEALQESEVRFRQIAEMAGEWLWEQDSLGHYTYSSAAVQEILGYQPEEIIGKAYLDLLTPQDKEHWSSELAPLPDIHRRFHRLVNRYRHRDGHEVFTESSGEPVFAPDGRLLKWRGVDYDITGRKRYEDALRLRDRAIEAASVGINIADARQPDYPNIYVNPALSRITGYSREELLGRNLRMLQGPDTDPAAVKEIGRSLQAGGSCEVVLKNYRKDGTPFWNSLLIAPVFDDAGTLTHYIGVQTDVTDLRRATEEHQELEIAKQIQLSLLPKQPLRGERMQVAGVCLPASHVGGDYFDYFFAGTNLDIVIADVSGHSVGAALIMAETRSALKAAIRQTSAGRDTPRAGEMLCALNDLLHDDLHGADLFISMFYVSFDPARRLLHYANAGHNRPLLLRGGELSCRQLDADGMIFGVIKDIRFEEKIEQLEKGDRLLLYTDGLTEAQNAAGEFFGVTRLCASFSALKNEPPQSVIRKLLEQAREFRGYRAFADDVSIVVLNVE